MLSDLQPQRDDLELIETPFYPQVTDQCGPSALATILNSSGVRVTPDALKSQVYIPDRKGSLQIELLAATRSYGRVPYQIETDVADLLEEIRAGRPVLVLQNLGNTHMPIWHYAVVVGYLANSRQFILRSGDQQRHLIKAKKFIRSWQKAGFWGILALRPGEIPASAGADEFIRSVAALEAMGDVESAATSYLAATDMWPENTIGWLGLGNTYYTLGDLDLAQNAYNRVLSADSANVIALYNLSQVQMDKGFDAEASATLDAALLAAKENSAIYESIQLAHKEFQLRQSSAAEL